MTRKTIALKFHSFQKGVINLLRKLEALLESVRADTAPEADGNASGLEK